MLRLLAALTLLLTPIVATAAPVHQLRIYELNPAKTEVFHTRFRDQATRIMARHGFRILAMWGAKGEAGPQFVYLLEWPDEAAMKAGWASFMADKEWSDIKAATRERHGAIMGGISEKVLHPTPYSPALTSR